MMSRWSYFQRALQVAWVCSRNLIEILIDRLRHRCSIPGPERLRLALEELSGSFLKFGQILSLQVDTLPREYCDALLSLLDRVPPFSGEQVREVFARDFGRYPEDLYKEFDYRPLAAASIGQVHRARLLDSTLVAVKVQRPGIEAIFLRDGALMRVFVKIVLFFRISRLYFVRDLTREFNHWVLDELDYRREATYAEVLERNARETPTERVPRIHWALTGPRILTMDFLEGYSVAEYLRLRERGDVHRLEELKQIGFDPEKFVSNVIHNFLSDAFKFGVYHADLHPANLLIMKDNVVGYVDFGIVGRMTPEARRKKIQLNLAYVSGKSDEIFDTFMSLSTFGKESNLPAFRRELEQRARTWYREPAVGGVPHFRKSLTVAMIDFLTLCRHYGVYVNQEMIKYIRSLTLADGLVSRLAPGLDLAPQIRMVCEEFIARDTRRRLLSGDAALTLLADLSGWMLAGPGRMLRAMETLERRQLRVQTLSETTQGPTGGIRIRALFASAVWLALTVFAFAMHRDIFTNPPFVSYLVIGFWCAWSLWLAVLLRRAAKQ